MSTVHDHSSMLPLIKFQGVVFGKIDMDLDFFRSVETRSLDQDLDEIIGLLESEIQY